MAKSAVLQREIWVSRKAGSLSAPVDFALPTYLSLNVPLTNGDNLMPLSVLKISNAGF